MHHAQQDLSFRRGAMCALFFPEDECCGGAFDLHFLGGSMLCVTHIVVVTTNGQVTFPLTISSKSVLRGGPILHVP